MADDTCKDNNLDKDIAVKICTTLNYRENDFEGGEGEWQCIVGKHFAASLQFDSKFLTFFDLIDRNKSFLIFKSGWYDTYIIIYIFTYLKYILYYIIKNHLFFILFLFIYIFMKYFKIIIYLIFLI